MDSFWLDQKKDLNICDFETTEHLFTFLRSWKKLHFYKFFSVQIVENLLLYNDSKKLTRRKILGLHYQQKPLMYPP